MINYAVKGHIKNKFHLYYQAKCKQCGYLHWYRKYLKPDDRFDGRKMKHMCSMELADTTIGTDTGEQLDMDGRLHTVVIPGKCEVKQGDLFQYGEDKNKREEISSNE